MIKEVNWEDESGALWLIYGGWGVGKTHSFGTLPGRTMIILAEMKNINRVLNYAKGNYKLYPLMVEDDGKLRYRTFDEFMGQMNDWLMEANAGEKPFDNLCIDSLSELQSIYGEAIEDQTHAKRVESGQRSEQMIDRYKKELAGFGVLNSAMGRTTKMLQRFTWYGINVICTAGIPDGGEWAEIKPYLIGKEYPSLLSGYFDFIGNVVEKGEDDPYPPKVRFLPHPKIRAKCGDSRLASPDGYELNWGDIIGKLNGEGGEKEQEKQAKEVVNEL